MASIKEDIKQMNDEIKKNGSIYTVDERLTNSAVESAEKAGYYATGIICDDEDEGDSHIFDEKVFLRWKIGNWSKTLFTSKTPIDSDDT